MIIFENLLFSIFLLYFSVEDMRKKSVSLKGLLVMLFIACVCRAVKLSDAFYVNYVDLIIALVCLGALFVCSLGFKFIGLGDVLVFVALAIAKGGRFVGTVLMLSLMLLGISGVMIIVYKRISTKTAIPYIPYIFICTLGVMACG